MPGFLYEAILHEKGGSGLGSWKKGKKLTTKDFKVGGARRRVYKV